MPIFENPYIQKVLHHPDIISESNIYTSFKGRWNEYFENTYPIVLEIGTGMGNFFAQMIDKNPKQNYIGFELRFKRLFSTANKAQEVYYKKQKEKNPLSPTLKKR